MTTVVTESLVRPEVRRITRSRNTSNGGAWTPWTWDGHTSFLTSEWKKKEWVRTPGFWKLPRTNLPENSFYHGRHDYACRWLTQTQTFYSATDGSFSHATQWQMSTYDYVDNGTVSEDGPYTYPEENDAIAAVQNKIAASQGSLAVSAAEIHKTAKLVGDSALKLVKAKRALFSGRFGLFIETLGLAQSRKTKAYGRKFSREMREAKKAGRENPGYGSRIPDFLAETWLEFSYGWKPLVKDVYDQCENLSTMLTRNEGEVFRVKAGAKRKRTGERVVLDNDFAKITKQHTWVTRTRYKISYALSDLSYRNVFGLNNPALVAWEVMPFSFIVDWFLPIGQYLEGLTAYNGVYFLKGTKSQKGSWAGNSTAQAKGVRVPAGSYKYVVEFDTTNFGDCTSVGLTRTRLTEFPSQTFPDVFRNASSIAHATTALSLLYTNFKGNRGSVARYR